MGMKQMAAMFAIASVAMSGTNGPYYVGSGYGRGSRAEDEISKKLRSLGMGGGPPKEKDLSGLMVSLGEHSTKKWKYQGEYLGWIIKGINRRHAIKMLETLLVQHGFEKEMSVKELGDYVAQQEEQMEGNLPGSDRDDRS